ncbi:MAG: extracellular solute-binding protein [Acidobacteriota bacterium]
MNRYLAVRPTARRFLLCVLGALLVAPAAPAAAEEILVWHAYRGAEKAAFEKVIELFNQAKQGDDMSARTLAVPYDAYADKISAAVPRGKGPDVFIFAQDRLGGWVEAGKTVESIDFFLDEEIEGRFIPSTLEAMTYQDQVFGLPVNFKVITQIYNKKLVQTPPTTEAELLQVAKSLTDNAAGRFGLAYPYSDFYYHASLMNAYGGGVFNAQRQPVVDQAANAKSLKKMMDWFKGEQILPAEPSTALITNLFNEGRAAIVFSGPWFLGEIDDSIDFGLALLPTIGDAGEPMKPWMTVEGAYIAQPSTKKDTAFEFIDFLTSGEAATVMALEGRQTPAVESVYDDAKVQADPILQAFRAQVDNAVPMPNYAEMTMMWSPMTTAMNVIVKGAASPEAALERAQSEVEERIADLRR